MRQLDTQVFLASTLIQITSRFGCYSEEQKVKEMALLVLLWIKYIPMWVEMARHHFESLESISFFIRLSPFSSGSYVSTISRKIELNE